MNKREQQEEKNKRIGWLTSVGVQLILLIVFYFIVAWREPFPPIPQYGIQLGFTTSSGATSSSPSPQQQPTSETANEEPIESEEEISEEIENIEEDIAEISPEVENDDVSEVTTADQQQPTESPPTTETAAQQEATNEEETEQVDAQAVMSPSDTENESENEDSEGESDNEEPAIDQRAIYGNEGTNAGNAEGANLALSGWVWDFKPKPNDNSDQSGKIVYKIVVDQDGYLVKIEPVTSTVSQAVERKYRQAVERLTFSKTASYKAAATSTGTITFIIKSR